MEWATITSLGPNMRETAEGYLVCRNVPIARTGPQIYYEHEVPPLQGDSGGRVHVDRDASEVFKPESIESFIGKPVVNDHPYEAVGPDNYGRYSIGYLSNPRRGKAPNDDLLFADLIVTTRQGIDAIKGGKRAISVGYNAHYEQTAPGLGRQRNIFCNHVALVDEGRCGSRCSIMDGKTVYSYEGAQAARDAAGFNESDHPRDDDGKFTEGAGGGGSATPTSTTAGTPTTAGSQTFSKSNPASGSLHGVKFEKWHDAPKDSAGWQAEADAGPDFPEPEAPDTKGKKLAAGVIVREKDGRVWMIRPKGGFGGYKASFPKGGVDKGDSLRSTAIKEAYEESGLRVRLTGYATDVARSTSHARYYHAERIGGSPSEHGWESEGVTLAHPEELHQHLNQPVDRRLARQALGDVDDKPMSLEGMTKKGSQLGSNPGGQYTDTNGRKFYVKQSKSNDHAKNEILAARLYEAAGSPILHAMPVDLGDGKLGTATEWRDVHHTIEPNDKEERRQAQKHFATHAWLANWDAAGLSYDNQGKIDGTMHTLDPGGSLIYRAQGSPKGAAFGDSVGEWDTLRDAGVNPQNHKLFGEMSNKHLRRSAENVTNIPDKEITRLTMKHGPGDEAARKALAARLIARKTDIAKRAGALTEDANPKLFRRVMLHLHGLARVA